MSGCTMFDCHEKLQNVLEVQVELKKGVIEQKCYNKKVFEKIKKKPSRGCDCLHSFKLACVQSPCLTINESPSVHGVHPFVRLTFLPSVQSVRPSVPPFSQSTQTASQKKLV